MKISYSILLAILALSVEPTVAQKKITLIDSLITSLHKQGRFNGNILIAEKGAIIYQKSLGIANEKTRKNLYSGSVFELASVAKQFTAMAIVMLKEQGKLAYDDTISKYLPQLSFYRAVTIRQLLYHNSGIPDYMQIGDSLWDKKKIMTNADLILLFATHQIPLLFEPNTGNEYSNTGYAFLASIVEKVASESYADFLNRHIFKPLGMSHTKVYTRRLKPEKIKDYAYGYVQVDSTRKYALPDEIDRYKKVYYFDGVLGHSNISSTLADLLKWDRALYNHVLISKESTDEMFRSGTLNNGKAVNYGFGWMLASDTVFGRIAAHTGGWPGYVTFIERHLDQDRTVIILQNHYTHATVPYKAIRNILYGRPLVSERKVSPVSQEVLATYIGRYQFSDIIVRVFLDKNILNIQLTGQRPFTIHPEGHDIFFVKEKNVQISFMRNPNGNIQKMIIQQDSKRIEAFKVD